MKFVAAKPNKGYSLVEVMVAITILMIAIVGPLTIAARGLQSTQYAKDETIAYLLAQEGIEAVIAIRNQRIIEGVGDNTLDDVWDWGDDSSLTPCFNSTGCNIDFHDESIQSEDNISDCSIAGACEIFYSPSVEEPMPRAPYHLGKNALSDSYQTKYRRTIRLTDLNTREVRMVSEVSWDSSLFGSRESVVLTSYVYKLYEQ